ncbi:helix-turn-helix transcriptional regulator [Bacteroidota bacterium]
MLNIGQKIHDVADAKNISAQVLAKKVERTRQTIYDIYNSRVSVTVDLLHKIAVALDEPIAHFFIEDPDSYYDNIPQVIPIQEVIKRISLIHEQAIRGSGMVNLRIFKSRDGMYIMESEFRELKDELSQEDIKKYEDHIDETIQICSSK